MKPCSHPGCSCHVTHPCEVCGRIWGKDAQIEEGEQVIRKLFTIIWKNYLAGDKVIRVTGWRSTLIESRGGARSRVTFCLFPWD